MTTPTEAVELARIILKDTEGGHPEWDLYTLNVHEARILARIVVAAADLADRLWTAGRTGSRINPFTARALASEIRDVLNGESND